MKSNIIIILCFVALIGCKKNDNSPAQTLPAVTSTGAMTFGCKVNDKIWLPTGLWGIDMSLPAISASYNQKSKMVSITALYDVNRVSQYVKLAFGPFTSSKDSLFMLNKTRNSGSNGTYIGDATYSTDSINNGSVIITRFDTIAHIVSGKFNYTAISSLGQKINVTEGRFDAYFQY